MFTFRGNNGIYELSSEPILRVSGEMPTVYLSKRRGINYEGVWYLGRNTHLSLVNGLHVRKLSFIGGVSLYFTHNERKIAKCGNHKKCYDYCNNHVQRSITARISLKSK